MNTADIVIIFILCVSVISGIILHRKSKKKGGCCCDNCGNCLHNCKNKKPE